MFFLYRVVVVVMFVLLLIPTRHSKALPRVRADSFPVLLLILILKIDTIAFRRSLTTRQRATVIPVTRYIADNQCEQHVCVIP